MDESSSTTISLPGVVNAVPGADAISTSLWWCARLSGSDAGAGAGVSRGVSSPMYEERGVTSPMCWGSYLCCSGSPVLGSDVGPGTGVSRGVSSPMYEE
jgi:hypothetical protein